MVASDRWISADSIEPRYSVLKMDNGGIQRLQEQQYGYDPAADGPESKISDDEMSRLLGLVDSGDTESGGGQKLMAKDLTMATGARDPDAENVDPQKSSTVQFNLPVQARAGEEQKPAAKMAAAPVISDGSKGGVATAGQVQPNRSGQMEQSLNRSVETV